MKILDWLFGTHDAPGRFDLPSYRDPIKAPKVQIKHAAKIILKNSPDSVIKALSGEWGPYVTKGTQGPLSYCPYVTMQSLEWKVDEKPLEVSEVPPTFNDVYIKNIKMLQKTNQQPRAPNSRWML